MSGMSDSQYARTDSIHETLELLLYLLEQVSTFEDASAPTHTCYYCFSCTVCGSPREEDFRRD